MTDETPTLETSLLDLPRREWLRLVEEIVDEDGYLESLGRRHHAIFVEKGNTLLVTFETLQGMHALSDMGQPLGWEMLRDHGWSHLC
ncbi:MAG: phosphoadenosine phosphosulfate reductase, partial [Sulfitobacter geojensis]